MAALPMVEDTDGASVGIIVRKSHVYSSSGQVRHTNTDNVSCHCVSKRKVPRDGDQNVNETCCPYAGDDNTRCSEMRIITDFIKN